MKIEPSMFLVGCWPMAQQLCTKLVGLTTYGGGGGKITPNHTDTRTQTVSKACKYYARNLKFGT